MRNVLEQFREWHANHFGDFAPEVNAELLCIDNAAAEALRKAVQPEELLPSTHPLTENEELAKGVLRLTKTVRYLVGIAERGEGCPMLDHETAEQFVLRYVQRLERALDAARSPHGEPKP